MKKLTQMTDNVSGVPYDVYHTTASELKARLIQDSKLSEDEILRFDSESLYKKTGFSVDHKKRRIEGERVLYATLGLESASFIISIDSKSGKWRLLDGYNRLFGTFESFEQEILVKAYVDISPRVWMNVMTYANAWKIIGASRSSFFMDRGFKWSLFEHFDIDLAISPTDDFENQLNLKFMDAYASGGYHYFYSDTVIDTLLNNAECIQDMAVMKEMVLSTLTFREVKKKVSTEFVVVDYNHKRYGQSLGIIKEKIIVALGRVRRWEIHNGLPQKPLTYSVIQELLERDDLQKHFVKLANMQVYGHAENFIKKNLNEAYKEHLMVALGHTYAPPAPKEPHNLRSLTMKEMEAIL